MSAPNGLRHAGRRDSVALGLGNFGWLAARPHLLEQRDVQRRALELESRQRAHQPHGHRLPYAVAAAAAAAASSASPPAAAPPGRAQNAGPAHQLGAVVAVRRAAAEDASAAVDPAQRNPLAAAVHQQPRLQAAAALRGRQQDARHQRGGRGGGRRRRHPAQKFAGWRRRRRWWRQHQVTPQSGLAGRPFQPVDQHAHDLVHRPAVGRRQALRHAAPLSDLAAGRSAVPALLDHAVAAVEPQLHAARQRQQLQLVPAAAYQHTHPP